MNQELITLILSAFLYSVEGTQIIPSTPQILFQPIGKVVSQMSYATIRISLNITELYEETNHLCRTAENVKSQIKFKNTASKNKAPLNKLLVHSMMEDIEENCLENTITIEEINEVFGLKHTNKGSHIPEVKLHSENSKNALVRKTRQILMALGAIATVAVTSLISIFATSTLVSMASGNDDEVVEESNRVITALQSHETRIQREEVHTKRIQDNIKQLEHQLVIFKQANAMLMNMFVIKTDAIAIANHLNQMKAGLFELLSGKLSPNIINTKTLEKAIKKIKENIEKIGYKLAIEHAAEALMSPASFVSFEQGLVVALLHIPMFKTQSPLALYKHLPIPINTFENRTNVLIHPKNSILAINNDFSLYRTFSDFELNHECQHFKQAYHCAEKGILRRTTVKDCLVSLYTKSKQDIINTCELELTKTSEIVVQQNTSTFLVYCNKPTFMHVTCDSSKEKQMSNPDKKYELIGYNQVILEPACKASLDNHVFSSHVNVQHEVEMKFVSLEMNLFEFVEIGASQAEEFEKFVTNNLKMLDGEQKTLKISDVKEKFGLHTLKKHNNLFNTIFGSFSGIATGAIFIILAICGAKRCNRNKAVPDKKWNIRMSDVNSTRHTSNQTDDTNDVIFSMEDDS